MAQEAASAPAPPPANAEVDKQIRIYKTTLLEGKDEQTRLDAATLLLFNGNGEQPVSVCTIVSKCANRKIPVEAECTELYPGAPLNVSR